MEKATLDDDKAINQSVAKTAGKDMKRVMPFVQEMRRKVLAGDSAAFERDLPFDEYATLQEMRRGLQKQTGCQGKSPFPALPIYKVWVLLLTMMLQISMS